MEKDQWPADLVHWKETVALVLTPGLGVGSIWGLSYSLFLVDYPPNLDFSSASGYALAIAFAALILRPQ